jgi:hypothetical protein
MQSKDEILADDWPVSRCERTERLIHSTSRPLQPTRQDLMIRFPATVDEKAIIMAGKRISVKKYVVRLSAEEREQLEALIRKG